MMNERLYAAIRTSTKCAHAFLCIFLLTLAGCSMGGAGDSSRGKDTVRGGALGGVAGALTGSAMHFNNARSRTTAE